MQGLDFGMDETYTDFLSKKRRKWSGLRNKKARILRDKKRKIKSGRTIGGRRALGHTGVRIPASVLDARKTLSECKKRVSRGRYSSPDAKRKAMEECGLNEALIVKTGRDVSPRGKAKGLFGKKSCKEQLMRMRMRAGGMEKFVKKCESRGDFTASKVKKKEKVAETLVANQLVKNERAIDKVEMQTQGAKEELAEQTKPLTEQKGFQKMLLPLLAGVGIVVLVGMK